MAYYSVHHDRIGAVTHFSQTESELNGLGLFTITLTAVSSNRHPHYLSNPRAIHNHRYPYKAMHCSIHRGASVHELAERVTFIRLLIVDTRQTMVTNHASFSVYP